MNERCYECGVVIREGETHCEKCDSDLEKELTK